MQIKSSVKAGGMSLNHNEKLVRSVGVRVRTAVHAGGVSVNHNEKLVRGRF
jgi:lipoate-protein ligase B